MMNIRIHHFILGIPGNLKCVWGRNWIFREASSPLVGGRAVQSQHQVRPQLLWLKKDPQFHPRDIKQCREMWKWVLVQPSKLFELVDFMCVQRLSQKGLICSIHLNTAGVNVSNVYGSIGGKGFSFRNVKVFSLNDQPSTAWLHFLREVFIWPASQGLCAWKWVLGRPPCPSS